MHFIFISVVLNCTAGILLKMGAESMGDYSLISLLSNIYYILSLLCLGMQAITWQLALKKFSLNFAYMFTSLYYPIILVLSFVIFGEYISWQNILGTIIIISGLILSQHKTKAI